MIPLFIAHEESVRECMQVLDEFHEISGLKIIVEKKSQTGAWRDSGTIFCQDLDLLWTNEFTSLGIQFDVYIVADITNLNIRSNIGDIKNLMRIYGHLDF